MIKDRLNEEQVLDQEVDQDREVAGTMNEAPKESNGTGMKFFFN